ncbi:LysR family transcriptional regulator [Parvibaculum sp.]|uniref:LysR family transcriptional regulator n=1 Tax=Parvibaculum sp. TaxID=2024848 RepID=UPI003BA86306
MRYFTKIAQLEHFGQAAQDLHVAQPALSRQIKQLEEELGVELFERLPRGVRLTAAGRVLLENASRLLDDVDRMVATTRATAEGKSGFIKVGFADGATYSGHVPDILGRFRKHNPKAEMELVPASSIAQATLLETESIDLGFVYWLPQNTAGIERSIINEERIVLAVSKSNKALVARKRLQLKDLNGVPFVWFKRNDGPMYYDLVLAECNKGGLNLNVVQEAFTESTMLSLVAADIGVTFITESARRRKPDNVVLLEIEDFNATITLQAMWRRSNRNPVLMRFIKELSRE